MTTVAQDISHAKTASAEHIPNNSARYQALHNELTVAQKIVGWSAARMKQIEERAWAELLTLDARVEAETGAAAMTFGKFMNETKQSLIDIKEQGNLTRRYFGRFGLIRERVEMWFWNFGLTIAFGFIMAKILPNNVYAKQANANNPFASTEPSETPSRRRPQAAA